MLNLSCFFNTTNAVGVTILVQLWYRHGRKTILRVETTWTKKIKKNDGDIGNKIIVCDRCARVKRAMKLLKNKQYFGLLVYFVFFVTS